MKEADRYHRFVRWSEEDQSYIGYCPDLYFGGVCHGESEEEVYTQLCEIVRDEVEHRMQSGEALPVPAVKVMRELEQAA
jgi:predicted RNase H-like HicB family nuclease